MAVAIVGIGRTEYSRNSGRTPLAMAAEAARNALADSGLTMDDVDGITCFQTGDSCTPLELSYALGRDELSFSHAMYAGGNAVADVLANAAAALEAGLCKAVLFYRSLNGRSGTRYGTVEGPIQVPGEWQFSAPHGYMLPPQWIATWCSRHQAEYGSTCEDLGAIAVQTRAHAVPNEHAISREPLDLDAYLAGRWVNEPFRVYDCAFEVDGAVAILLTTDVIARNTAKQPVWVHSSAASQGTYNWAQGPDMTSMYSKIVAPRLWNRSGLKPSDMDVALMYDCFTYTVMATMEDFGFCEKGQVGDYYRAGKATYGGDVVVNPHGGLLSEGYIHGLNHHYEAVVQLRGDAGVRQVPNCKTALVTAGAGPYGGANILMKEKP